MHERTDRPHEQRERRSGHENTDWKEERKKQEEGEVCEEAPRLGRERRVTGRQSPARIGPPWSCIRADVAGACFRSARFRKAAISCWIR